MDACRSQSNAHRTTAPGATQGVCNGGGPAHGTRAAERRPMASPTRGPPPSSEGLPRGLHRGLRGRRVRHRGKLATAIRSLRMGDSPRQRPDHRPGASAPRRRAPIRRTTHRVRLGRSQIPGIRCSTRDPAVLDRRAAEDQGLARLGFGRQHPGTQGLRPPGLSPHG